MEFDIASLLIGVLGGIAVSYGIIYWISGLLIERLQESSQDTVDDAKNIDMKIEKHGEILYAFRTDNNDFVCQGTDLKELRTHFAQRFPDYNGTIVDAAKELHEELTKQKKDLPSEVGRLQ